MLARVFVTMFTVFVAPFAAAHDDNHKWVDLTYDLSSASIFWPTAKPFQLTIDAQGVTELGYYYSAFSFCTAEHGGTHIDAPVHFAQGRESVHQIALERLIGSAFVVDVTAQAKSDRDYQIGTGDLLAWERQHGQLPSGAIVLFRTGFGDHWPDAESYLGTAQRGEEGARNLHFPGLHADAAKWLVRERQVGSVGIDTASIDHGQSRSFRTHVTLMTANVPAFENVANLDLLPATGAFVVALPVKIKGGSGGPLRIVARIPDSAGFD